MELDPVVLSRIQFAFTISFHIIFPALTIGLSSWLAVVEGIWLFTGREVYKEIYKLWVKIFAVTFGMGVVSGVIAYYFADLIMDKIHLLPKIILGVALLGGGGGYLIYRWRSKTT